MPPPELRTRFDNGDDPNDPHGAPSRRLLFIDAQSRATEFLISAAAPLLHAPAGPSPMSLFLLRIKNAFASVRGRDYERLQSHPSKKYAQGGGRKQVIAPAWVVLVLGVFSLFFFRGIR
ncbi:hypothetical protein C8J57DRAFT_1730694 [Mycena rebaudengoi]|nr:hypothetical protein C8J57DRAFT_1730694 [Mycena rebaudengoi]